jgi:Flp pilus assembly pilin Flp
MRQPGQTLTDYTLIMALLAVVSIGGLVAFGEQIKTFFSNQQSGLKAASVSLKAGLPTTALAGRGTAEAENSPATTASAVDLAGSKTLGFLGAASSGNNLASMVETSGVNGTLTVMADTLEEKAKLLQDSGKIDQPGYDTIITMANKAHRLGAAAKSLEDATNACKGDSNCLAALPETLITFEGQQYLYKYFKDYLSSTHLQTNTVETLNSNINTCITCLTGKEVLAADPGSSGYKYLRDFTKQWQAVQGVVGNDPLLKRQLDELGTQIYITTAQLAEAAASPASNPSLATRVASELNHYNAGTVCDKGSGKDTGTKCNPNTTAVAVQ